MAQTVLIVDDNEEFTAPLQQLLSGQGYNVEVAHDGEKGFAIAKDRKPDVITLDMMMTHCSEGMDLCQQLREDDETRNIPLILITGVGKAAGLNLQVNAVLQKPVEPDALLNVIEKLLK